MIKKPFRMHQIIIPMQRNVHEYVLNKHTSIIEKQNTYHLPFFWYGIDQNFSEFAQKCSKIRPIIEQSR